MLSLQFYLDANLTMPLTDNLEFEQEINAGPEIKVVYFGSNLANKQFEAALNPGVDPIIIEVVNAGESDINVKLPSTFLFVLHESFLHGFYHL